MNLSISCSWNYYLHLNSHRPLFSSVLWYLQVYFYLALFIYISYHLSYDVCFVKSRTILHIYLSFMATLHINVCSV